MCRVKSILNLLSTLLLVSTIFIGPASAEIKKDDIVIKAGLMKKISDYEYIVYKETTRIPYITKKMNPGFFFGYTLNSKSDVPFYHVAVINAPSTDNVSGDFIDVSIKSEGRMVVTTKKILNKHYGYYSLFLNEDDPSGFYAIKIYINDELLTTIDFNVEAPANKKQEASKKEQ